MQVQENVSPLVQAARRIAADMLAADAQRVDREAAFPSQALRAMADAGFCGMTIPAEYGGNPADTATICRVTEELARGCPSTAAVLMAYVVGIQPLVDVGTQEQKQAYLPDLAKARRSICFAISEAHAGSDISAMHTTAKRHHDGWVLNGTKCLIGNAVGADLCIVGAKTDPEAGHKGVSVFVVEAATPGYSVSHVYEKMGMRGTTTGEITFDNVVVPLSALLGAAGRGSEYLLRTLDLARLTLAAEAIGLAQAALEQAVAYAKQRTTFGEPLATRQAIQFTLADMATSLHASRTMLYHACALCKQGKPFNMEASMVKLFASETASRVTDSALQIFGGWGLVDRSRVEALYRDARYTRIWEGASEIQRMIIARSLLRERAA